MILWMMSIAISVSLLVVSAALGPQYPAIASAHLVVAGMVSTVIALLAFREVRRDIAAGRPQMLIAASLTRYMGLIWAWIALVISITYGTGILEWSGWSKYFIGLMLVGGLCLFLSRVLRENAQHGSDESLLTVARYLACATLFAMVTTLAVFGINRWQAQPVSEPGMWAADNVFFFGAAALAAVSRYLLKASANRAL